MVFLYGNDEYAIAQRAREFASMFANASEAEMNTAHLDARTMTEDQWVNAVNALPFLAKQRLVLLANPTARVGRGPAKGAAAAGPGDEGARSAEKPNVETIVLPREKFLGWLEHVPETTQLVITETVELRSKQDKAAAEKHWLAQWMRKNHHGVEFFAQPIPDMMPGWITKYARGQGGEILGQAARTLAEMVGTDTRQAAQEVTKLLTYVNWSRPVTAADVEALSPLTAAPDVFKMVDALAAGNGKEAQHVLHRLLEYQDAFGFWGMIIRQFRYLLVAREVLDARGGEPEAVKALTEVEGRQVQPFVARKALSQARGFKMAKLEAIYHQLLEIDEGAKTGRMPLELALDLLVAELAR